MRSDLRADGWATARGVAVRGRAFADESLLGSEAIAERFADAVSGDHQPSAVASVAADLEGFFAAVVLAADGGTYLVNDRARSIPLYYASDGSVVSDRGRVVRDAVGGDRNPTPESEFLLTRYVTGSETIWERVASTSPGEVVHVDGETVRRQRYHDYWPDSSDSDGVEAATERLSAGFETALDRLQAVADGRPVVVPLSGGYDSRLIAAGLVDRDHEVIGFTFGRSGHPDVEMSREVADRLGIRWEFVSYNQSTWRDWYHGEAGRKYRRHAFGGDSLPFVAEGPAVHRLVTEGRIPSEALICPGHTVATPSERLPLFVENGGDGSGGSRAIEPTVDGLVTHILNAHYDLWEWDSEQFRDAAAERIRRGLLGDRPESAVSSSETAAAAYERWEWTGRMATFTNGDLRLYEDAGLDWWLPLWDPAYVEPWSRLPLAVRRGKWAQMTLATDTYQRAGSVPSDRVEITDRGLSPGDRTLSLLRHTPVEQFIERDGDWQPPFLTPRSRWNAPGSHPLAWYGILSPSLWEQLDDIGSLYALRTLEATGRLDLLSDDTAVPSDGVLELPEQD